MAPSELYERHRATLESAVEAIRGRHYWSPYPESPSPKVYGEGAAAAGEAAFQAYLGKDFPLDQVGADDRIITERSPYGLPLGVGYPRAGADELIAASAAAGRPWARTDPDERAGADELIAAPAAAGRSWARTEPDERAGVCLEILDRINKRSFEMAHAVQHTSGQAFVMAFQAGGPHAQERGLEAVAYAHDMITGYGRTVRWEKPQRRGEPLVMEKRFRAVPRGIGLVIGCNTFPPWNAYPAVFADL